MSDCCNYPLSNKVIFKTEITEVLNTLHVQTYTLKRKPSENNLGKQHF